MGLLASSQLFLAEQIFQVCQSIQQVSPSGRYWTLNRTVPNTRSTQSSRLTSFLDMKASPQVSAGNSAYQSMRAEGSSRSVSNRLNSVNSQSRIVESNGDTAMAKLRWFAPKVDMGIKSNGIKASCTTPWGN